jgi:hypothetical protein
MSKVRGDEGKAKPSSGSNKVGEKWGWIPAAAGKNGKHHPATDLSTIDGGVTDRGKNGLHGHHYPGRPLPGNK